MYRVQAILLLPEWVWVLAAGYTMPEAMHLANTAAGVVVAKLGTAVCSFAELTKALEEQ